MAACNLITVSERVVVKKERVGFGAYALRCTICNEVTAFTTMPLVPDLPALTLEEALNDVRKHLAKKHKLVDVEIGVEEA